MTDKTKHTTHPPLTTAEAIAILQAAGWQVTPLDEAGEVYIVTNGITTTIGLRAAGLQMRAQLVKEGK